LLKDNAELADEIEKLIKEKTQSGVKIKVEEE